jgi:hypothetical protein
MKRQVTITISIEDLQQYFECTEEQAMEIWDEIDEEHDIEETLETAVMEQFNVLMWNHRANTHP